MGISFNIIDGKRGEKADLSPLTRDSRYRQAFGRRIRYEIKWPGEASFMAWCARPDDVIYGKFLAWDEGRSRKHEADIYDMLVSSTSKPTRRWQTHSMRHTWMPGPGAGTGCAELWQSINKRRG